MATSDADRISTTLTEPAPVGAPVTGSKVPSAIPDGVNHLTSQRRAKLSFCLKNRPILLAKSPDRLKAEPMREILLAP